MENLMSPLQFPLYKCSNVLLYESKGVQFQYNTIKPIISYNFWWTRKVIFGELETLLLFLNTNTC